jgi:hypothetical protein
MTAAAVGPTGPLYLVDKSAIARSHLDEVARRLAPLYPASRVATCPIIDLELLYSVRSGGEHELLRRRLRAMRSFPVNESVTDRAVEVQGLLARSGRHRLPVADLLIAAVAEANELTVLHYDKDFDTIAEATGQPTEWVAPRGSL